MLLRGGDPMATCAETKPGEIYVCDSCGFEYQVITACSCGCTSDGTCCGKAMTLKKAADEADEA
jgi:hypothetical protein